MNDTAGKWLMAKKAYMQEDDCCRVCCGWLDDLVGSPEGRNDSSRHDQLERFEGMTWTSQGDGDQAEVLTGKRGGISHKEDGKEYCDRECP